MAAALVEADRDSGAFEASIRNKGVAALGRLVSEAERIKQLIDDLANAIEQVADTSQPNMTGDIVAARALATAARQIQERNEEEAIQQR